MWVELLSSNKINCRPDSWAIFSLCCSKKTFGYLVAICATRLEVVSGTYHFLPVAGLVCQVRPLSQGAVRECIFVMYVFGCMPAS